MSILSRLSLLQCVTAQVNDDITHYKGSLLVAYPGQAVGEVQSIPTYGVIDLESFQIGEDYYLAVANFGVERYEGVSDSTQLSKLYKYDASRSSSPWHEVQSFETNGAWDIESFTMEGSFFLAVSSLFSDCKIFKFNSSRSSDPFELVQSIGGFTPSITSADWEYFEIGGISFLGVAITKKQQFSKIYQYNSTNQVFEWFQDVGGTDFDQLYDLEVFQIENQIENQHFLAAANFNQQSKIYKYTNNLFVLHQTLESSGGAYDFGRSLLVSSCFQMCV